MKNITCQLPDKLDLTLARLASKRRITKSQLVKELLSQACKERNKQAPRAIELVADFAGWVNGPRDLSTNCDYFNSFGT